MVFKKPFIASDFSKWKNKLGRLYAGLFIPAGSSDALANAIISLKQIGENEMQKMGINGYNYVLSNNWEKEKNKLLETYYNILND